MGGTNQATLNPPAASGAKAANPIRIHQNNGEVHLHDDISGDKFACAVPDFYAAWNDGKTRNFSPALEIVGTDGKGNPAIAKFVPSTKNGVFDISISIEKPKFGDTINQIDKFISGG